MFVRGTRRRGNEGRKTRAHTTVWHAGCRPTDCLSPINGLPSLRLTHSNPRGGFSTARLRGPRVHTHGAERGNQADTILLRSKKNAVLLFRFPPFLSFVFCFELFHLSRMPVLAFSDGRRSFRFGILCGCFFFFNCTLLRAQELKFRF